MIPPFLIAAADDTDVAELVELDRLCSSHPWTRRHFEDAVRELERTRVIVARSPATILGCCCIELVADELHVHNLAVHPDQRRQGLARLLLAVALRLGRPRGAKAAFLEVREGNHPARELYQAIGFRSVGRRRGYYAEPLEDALLLRRDGP